MTTYTTVFSFPFVFCVIFRKDAAILDNLVSMSISNLYATLLHHSDGSDDVQNLEFSSDNVIYSLYCIYNGNKEKALLLHNAHTINWFNCISMFAKKSYTAISSE